MKKRNNNRFLLFLGTIALALGFGETLKQKDINRVGAAQIPAGTELYLRPNDNWLMDNARFAAYFFLDSDENEYEWTDLVAEPGVHKIYKTTSPATPYDKVIFTRMNGAEPENNWNNKWNQSQDLEFPTDGRNMFVINEGAWGGGEVIGDWSSYLPVIIDPPLPEGIDRNHVRLWIDRGGHYDTTDYMYVLNIGEHNYTPSGYTKALVFGTDGIYFPYFDLPSAGLSGANIEIFVIYSGSNNLIATIGTVPFIAGDNNKLWRVGRNAEDTGFEVTKGALIGRVYASFVAKVLEGYLTCDANTDNGYMAFGQVDANFIPRTTDGEGKEVWDVEGRLSGIMIKDYENEANYLTGERETEANTDAYAKYMRMQTLFLANGGTLGGAPERVIPVAQSSNNLIMLFGIMFAFGLIGFIAYKKKRA